MPELTAMKEKETIYQLDVLRGVAILAVFVYHYLYAFYPDFQAPYKGFFVDWQSQPHQLLLSFSPLAMGWMGVPLFFVISGFLIHYFTLKKGVENFELWHFYNKRFWRIYPPYLIALLFFSFIATGYKIIKEDPADFWTHLFLLHNFFAKYNMSEINGAFWSLATEFNIYMVYPVFLWGTIKFGVKKVLAVLIAMSLFGAVVAHVLLNSDAGMWGYSIIRHYFIWGFGALLAENYIKGKRQFGQVSWWVVFFVFVCLLASSALIIHRVVKWYMATWII
jgi:peptidoglycan/LPS O-acetylase OafA/YrhL